MSDLPTETYHKVRRRHLRNVTILAMCGVLAVLAGVYGIGHLRRNPGDAACAGAVNTGARLKSLAHGEIAALTLARTPFRLPDLAFKSADGHDKTLADWRGRTVLLNLWATWCVPCRQEMPALDALQAKLGGPDFEVVAVNIDTRDPQKPLAFLKDVGITHLAYFTDQSAHVFEDLKEAGKAFGMPTTVLIDRVGCEIGNMAGPAEWASDAGVKLVSAAIAGDNASATR
jgi:thiol-disulfide isomerase/thioredoxin